MSEETPLSESKNVGGTTETTLDILQHVQRCSALQVAGNPIYNFLFARAVIVSSTKGSLTAHLKLAPEHLNTRGSIHGTTTAGIVDWAGSLAIASHLLSEKTGPSVDMHINYIGTAALGDTLEIGAVATKVGRSLAFTEVKIFKLVDGGEPVLVATASHTKYIRKTMDEIVKKG